MKSKNILWLFSLALLTGCSFVQNPNSSSNSDETTDSTSQELIQLNYPSNIVYDDANHVIKWDIVDNCSGYKVKINSNVYETQDVSFKITTFKFDQEFYYQVMSIGIPGLSKDSPYSPNMKDTFSLNGGGVIPQVEVPEEDTAHNDEKEEIDNSPTAYGDGGETVDVVETKAIAKQNENYQTPITSYYDDSYNYYVFDLGYLQDVPLETSTQFVKYGGWQGVNATLEFVRTQTNTTSMQTTTQEVATSMTKWDYGASGSAKVGSTLGKDRLISMSAEIQFGVSASMGTSDSKSWSTTYSKCEQATETMSTKINLTFTQSCPTGYYRYALIGDVSVYGVLIQDKETKEYECYNFTSLNAWGYGLDFSKERGVIQYGSDKLTFNVDDVLPTLEQPTFYLSQDIQDQGTEQTGESDKPFLIGSVDDINKIVDNNKKGTYFKLTNNIDFAGADNSYLYDPIEFNGVLEGNGYAFRNYILGSLDKNDSCGFFLKNNGTIKNVMFDNIQISSVTNSQDLTMLKAGVICGTNNGSIINVIVSNSKLPDCNIGESMYGNYSCFIGGVAGVNETSGIIERSGVVNTTIKAKAMCGTSSSTCYVSGIAGQNNGKITNVYSRRNNLTANATGAALLSVFVRPVASSYASSLVGLNAKGGTVNYGISNNNNLNATSSGATTNNAYRSAFVAVNNGSTSYCYTSDSYNFKYSGNDIKNSKKVTSVNLANCSYISKTLWADSSDGPVINYDWKQ